MYDYTQDNLTIATSCTTCLALDQKCDECSEVSEARNANLAHEIVDESNDIYARPWHKTDDQPSGSDWISSVTYRGIARKIVQMVETWDDNCHLVELTVKFVDPTEDYNTRHEFLPPIVQLIDGGELDNLWELDDLTQYKREVVCQWCHIMTPNILDTCQSCDKVLA